MPPVGPVSRRDLIKTLRRLGFEGPYSSAKHQYMVRGQAKVFIPNPHTGDISRQLVARLMRQARISRSEWESV